MRDILITGITFWFLIQTFRKPYIGVMLWTWFSLMNPHRLAYGFAYSFPFAQLVAAVTLVSLLTGKYDKPKIWTRETIVLALLFFWVCITTIFAVNPSGAYLQFDRYWKILLFVYLTIFLVDDRKKLNVFISVIVFSIGFYSVKGGIFTILTGGGSRVWGPDGSFISGNNELALATLMIVPLMWYLRSQTQNRWIRLGLLAAFLLSSASILGSQSRGAFLGILAIGAFFWAKSRQKVLATLVVLFGAVLMVGFMPDSWWDRMDTIRTYHSDASAESRITVWEFAWNVANNNILGGGANMYQSNALRAKYSPDPSNHHDLHSIYFEMLGEQGWIGFTLFILVGVFTWARLGKIVKLTKKSPEWQWAAELALMLQVGLIGYAVSGAFLGLAYFDLPYDLMAATVILWRLISQAALVSEKPNAASGPNGPTGIEKASPPKALP